MRVEQLAHAFLLGLVLIILNTSKTVDCYENYELDLFDLVEDVGENFYDYFGVKQDSSSNEIKKAYRKLSLQWHPDKNSDPAAEKKFRHIVGIYEVLKDDVKRHRYDEVLEFGLPDWREPIFYFRRVRKLSALELTIALSIIISIGHYFVMWAQYFEQKLTIEDRIGDIKKKLEKKKSKKRGGTTDLDEIDASLQKFYDELPKPTLKNTLPVRLTKWFFRFIRDLPWTLKDGIMVLLSRKKNEDEDDNDDYEDIDDYKPHHKAKSRQSQRSDINLNPKKIEKSDIKAPVINYDLKNVKDDNNNSTTSSTSANASANKEWNDKEKTDLIKAIAKFPAGTINRWNKVSAFVATRSEQECIQMEKQMKASITSSSHSNLNSNSFLQRKNEIKITEEPTIAVKENQAEASDGWTQEHQLMLEKALKEIGKDVPNRWEKIAQRVPSKTKDECIERFKNLCSALKKKQ